MKKSRIIAGGLALVMAFGLAACGSSSQGSADGGEASGEKVAFTIFNSKNEIQEYLEEARRNTAKPTMLTSKSTIHRIRSRLICPPDTPPVTRTPSTWWTRRMSTPLAQLMATT